jgi:hypothetical protein
VPIFALYSVNHSFPSLSIAILPDPILLVGVGYSVILPGVVTFTFPILCPVSSAKHALPSGSVVMPQGDESFVDVTNSSMASDVKLSRPILQACISVNHNTPLPMMEYED